MTSIYHVRSAPSWLGRLETRQEKDMASRARFSLINNNDDDDDDDDDDNDNDNEMMMIIIIIMRSCSKHC